MGVHWAWEFGASFIVTIPKKIRAQGIKDYCRISLIGSIYKIVSKVYACKIQKVLPSIISKSQVVFVCRRQILDDVLVENEWFHLRHKNKKSGLICKSGFEKAYNRVDWGFLQYLLPWMMGFVLVGEALSWMVEAVSFVDLINGFAPAKSTPVVIFSNFWMTTCFFVELRSSSF